MTTTIGDGVLHTIRTYLMKRWHGGPDVEAFMSAPGTVSELFERLRQRDPEASREILSEILRGLANGATDRYSEDAIAREQNISRANREFGMVFELTISDGVRPDAKGFDVWVRRGELDQATNAVRDSWILGKGLPFLTLAGTPGVGKSHLLEAAACELREQGALVVYRSDADMMAEWRRAVGQSQVEELFEQLSGVPNLIWDDLGVSALSDAGKEFQDRLVDHRWRNRMRTLVATNMKSSEISARVASRLADVDTGDLIQISAPDYRRRVK